MRFIKFRELSLFFLFISFDSKEGNYFYSATIFRYRRRDSGPLRLPQQRRVLAACTFHLRRFFFFLNASQVSAKRGRDPQFHLTVKLTLRWRSWSGWYWRLGITGTYFLSFQNSSFLFFYLNCDREGTACLNGYFEGLTYISSALRGTYREARRSTGEGGAREGHTVTW